MYFDLFMLWLNTMASMINTNVFFDVTGFQASGKVGVSSIKTEELFWQWIMGPCKRTLFPTTNMNGNGLKPHEQVKSVFIVHVGGTRCVTSSTDHYMKIHVRIPLTVECIRPCIFFFYFMCKYNCEYDQY